MNQAAEDIRVAQLNAERACSHGAMVRRAGVSHAGKAWAGWFCPQDYCHPDWVPVRDIISDALDDWAYGNA